MEKEANAMSNRISNESPQFAQLDDRELAAVAGGSETDWVNVGGGIASGYCAFGPISKFVIQKSLEVIRRIR
jgi:hypothetical protein